MESAQLAVFAIAFVVMVAIWSVVGAVILRAAIELYKKFAGAGTDVPMPSFGWAMVISLVSAIMNSLAGFVVGLTTGTITRSVGIDERTAMIVTQLIAMPVNVIMIAMVLNSMLPTSFRRGVMIALCQFLIIVALAAIMFAFAAIVMIFSH
jgi:hypothetical protein